MYDDEKITAFIEIAGYDISPDAISDALGIKPHVVRRKGEIWREDPKGLEPPLLRKENTWSIWSNLPEDKLPEEHVEDLLKQISSSESAFKELSKKYSTTLEIEGRIEHPHVSVFLDKELVAKLAELNISLGVSIYALTPDYLQSQEQRSELASFLASVDEVTSLNKGSHDEVDAIIMALKAIEDHAATVQNSLVRQLLWVEVPEAQRKKDLKDIKDKLKKIQDAISRSKYLAE